MNELIKKDWLIIKTSKIFIFPIFYLIIGMHTSYSESKIIPLIPIMFIYYIIVTLNAFDYKYNATTFLLSFPIRKKDWVASKYLICLICCFISFFTLFILRIPYWLVNRTSLIMDIGILIFIHCIAIVFIACSLLGYFKFGYMKMRMLNFFSLAITMSLSTIATQLSTEYGFSILILSIFVSCPLILLYSSYRISIQSTKQTLIL